jgi:hypothetical protein
MLVNASYDISRLFQEIYKTLSHLLIRCLHWIFDLVSTLLQSKQFQRVLLCLYLLQDNSGSHFITSGAWTYMPGEEIPQRKKEIGDSHTVNRQTLRPRL